jgi:RNA polymerase sigma-70 factor (ECF subfamily)
VAYTISKSIQISESQLLALAREGNRDAFGALIQRYWEDTVEVACTYIRNRADAEDQAQNASLKAFEHLHQYRGEGSFRQWLAGIVSNECRMRMRSERRARFVYLDERPVDPYQKPVQVPSSYPDHEGLFAYDELIHVLRAEVKHIPALMRNVILLRDVAGLSLSSVASELGISVSAVKSRLVRGRSELCDRIRRRCKDIGRMSALSRTAAPLDHVARRPSMFPAHY